jgi:seryl-tRNA synthetase
VSEAGQGYELEMFKMVVNKYLDENTSFTERNLNELETKRDQIVWDLTTKIYQQSGHKVELSLVRDIVNSRIRTIKHQLTEEARLITEQKAQQAAEESRRIAEEKIRHAAEEVRLSKNRPTVLAKAQQIVSEQLEVNIDEVNLDSPIPWFGDTSGWCSDMEAGLAIDVLTALEEAFEIEIPDGVGGECLSSSGLLVMEIVDFIARKIAV